MDKVSVSVNPGICSFGCWVTISSTTRKAATIEIQGSECKMVNLLGASLTQITIFDLFQAHTQNIVFQSAEKANCHPCCPVPIAIVKASEVALGLALPRDVSIHFQ